MSRLQSRLLALDGMATRKRGITAALLSALFMGLSPVLGKTAMLAGAPPLAVVTLRTLGAAGLLLAVVLFYRRSYLYIYPAGLLGCLLAGWVNGIGSLFYYSALGRLDAGIAHLLYSLYPLFLVIWLALDRQSPTRLTLVRIGLAIPAVYLLAQAGQHRIDLLGVIQMLIGAALYALHIPINQRVLYDMPAPTVTLYTLLAMSSVVAPAYFLLSPESFTAQASAWLPVIGLTLVTFFSRLALFSGVKHLGGMQTALLGFSELLVAVSFSYLFLGERLSAQQWLGAGLLITSLLLVALDNAPPRGRTQGGWLSWLN